MYQKAYLGGTFDCLHRGHLALFARARKVAQQIVVGLNTDEFAERYKRKPLMPLADRMAVLQACRLVDRVVLNVGNEDSKPAILHSGADCVVHGSDWQGDSLMRQMGLTPSWLDAHGIALVILPYTDFVSTTQILAGRVA
jgi:cytidyltransferase-like protein